MILPLSALRFFVIVLIYAHHLGYPGGLGPAAVTFFFVLSGFIMAHNNSQEFVHLNTAYIRSFYARRLSRLYPLHVLTFILSVPIVYLTSFKTNSYYALLNICLLQSYIPNGIQVFSFNGVAWFMSDIAFFYFATPFVLYVLLKTRAAGNNKMLPLLLIILLFCEIGTAYLFSNGMEPYSFGWWFIYISPYFRLFDYIVGLVLGLVFVTSKGLPTHHSSIDRAWFSLLEVISILLFVCSFHWARYIPYPSIQMGAYFTPFCILLIYIFSLQRGVISLILSGKMFVYLGGLSFTIYLIHQLAISYTALVFGSPIYGMMLDPKHIAAQLLLFFVIICISDVIARYFEDPTRNWLLHKAETSKAVSIKGYYLH